MSLTRSGRVDRPRSPGVDRPRSRGVDRPRSPGVDRPRSRGVDRPRSRGVGWRGEDGATPITSVLGVAVFLTFLLLVVQLMLYMLTANVVQAAATDGASHGAGAAQANSVAAAQDRAEAVLGGLATGSSVTGTVRSDGAGDVLRVTVRVRTPSAVARGFGIDTIERAAESRVEQ